MTGAGTAGGATTAGAPDGVRVVALAPRHEDALVRFFTALPEGDRTFIEEDVADPAVVRTWAAAGHRWIAVAGGPDAGDAGGTGGAVVGYVAARPLPGWSDHVAEIRLVVAPDRRGTGLGRLLARHALVQAVEAGRTKLVVEVVAEQGAALALFTALGFTGEALLRDHIRDRRGELRDLMVLAHHVGDTWSGMDTVGLADALDADTG
ncbi:GNAT family N-acetyltransferase [Geodermatophilus sp. YIM 151500]|uniref:GNAT family N-acetyltransferase n=1 Tax=Geodermatophilus sp. YIM 151500 TaxID=2984531 RepID=UPI0021E498E4|nr:GNAT family N-acetyltransferase [Geodermatophilus sp. YIM 151500]MCV2488737.1 GNAT family N-acetyltransferase [Geodermatophilus sp. YIM 151500]